MPSFSHLRSDYPLNLTWLERPYVRALTPSYRAGLPSARAIRVSFIGSNWWFLSWPFVDRAFDAQHYSSTDGLNIDEQLVHLVEHWCARPRGNNGRYSYALAFTLFSPNSALYAVAAVHLLSTSGCHSPITTVLCAAFQMRNSTQEVHFGPITFWRASSVDSRASQIDSSQIN
jgi:hypothetical protein